MDSVYHVHSPAVQHQHHQQHQQHQQQHEQQQLQQHQHPQQQSQQQQHQHPRRGSQSVTLAPTAAMLDPNLGTHGKSPQTSHEFGSPQMQRFDAILNNHQHDLQPMLEHGSSRALPSIEVTDDSLDNAYVDFILYCNPAIPTNVDTTELRKGFRSPPKSDGKSFSPFILFGLITKLEAKEIKTWVQLVSELGVEQPDLNKNQSSQKVQQYAVRLKRWLHAFHVDAFFHYCLGIPNSYYTDRPMGSESLPEAPRDNVAPEDDLALRALLPVWRPKRGRRKAEDNEMEHTPSRKAQFRRSASTDFFTSFEEQYAANPPSAAPWSAQPQGEPLAAVQVAIAPKAQNPVQTPVSGHLSAQPAGQQIRWRLNHQENPPSTPYPQSAITPRHRYSGSPSFEEPRSANPTSVGKSSAGPSRKRRGIAVSSAWPGSSNGVSTGKTRGRPPSNRSFQDGPYSTFPANPTSKEGSTINVSTPVQPATSSPSQGQSDQGPPDIKPPEVGVSPKGAAVDLSEVRKRSKLQLQVPEHAGGPVRLATPPQLLINGESNRHSQSSQEQRSSADFLSQIEDDDASDLMDVDGNQDDGDGGNGIDNVNWKRRALVLKRKLQAKEDELKALKLKLLDAVRDML